MKHCLSCGKPHSEPGSYCRACGHAGYVDEFAFRLNEGNCGRRTLDRLDSFVDGVAGKRLSYNELIAKPEAN